MPINLMIFQAWGLIYAIMQVLMTAINLDSINNVLSANGILNGFVGSTQISSSESSAFYSRSRLL